MEPFQVKQLIERFEDVNKTLTRMANMLELLVYTEMVVPISPTKPEALADIVEKSLELGEISREVRKNRKRNR